MLEDEVDEKYYLSDKMINFFYKNERVQKEKGNGFRFGVSDGNVVAKAVTTRAGSRMDDNFIRTKNKRLHSMLDKIDITKVQAIDMYNQTTHDNEMHTITTRVDASNCTAITQDERIRKLTPKECWRLMGFDDEDVEKAAKVNSNTQLYKQAGNSIVVNVLEAILTNLLLNTEQIEVNKQTTIYDYL
jgi:DNA (cytosine-5)-methyltransferase 1